MLLPADNKYDNRDVILEVESGAGGAEAMIFAFELLTMYQKYAAYKGWDWGIISMEKGGTGGNYQRMKAMGMVPSTMKDTSSLCRTQDYKFRNYYTFHDVLHSSFLCNWIYLLIAIYTTS